MEIDKKYEKVVKKIDIERLVYRSSTVMSWVALVCILLNRWLFHVEWLSFVVCGYCIALFIMDIIVGIAGNINYKNQMDYYRWLSTHLDEIDKIVSENQMTADEIKEIAKDGKEDV